MKIKELQKNMWTISARIIGDSSSEITSKEINEIIKDDILSTFTNVDYINLDVDLETVEDKRTTKFCYIFKIEMLLKFKTSNDDNTDIIHLVGDYITKNFLKKLD